MALLYLVRHGESPVNVTRTFSYQRVDPGLTERGNDQAQAVARYFAGKPIARVFSGPLQRAQRTAEYVANATGTPLEIVEALRELNVGELEGRSDRAGWDIHNVVLDSWRQGKWDIAFPGGENFHQVRARITGFLERLATDFPDQDLVAVGHGGIFCSVLPLVCDIPNQDGGAWLTLANTGVSIFKRGEALSCEQWNGQAHLA